MNTELQNKVTLVTGGTTGIGRDTAVLFAKSGAKVVVSGRRETEGKETSNLIRAAGGDGLFVKSDVSKSSDVQSLVQKTVEKFGRLDIAFNNAGIEGKQNLTERFGSAEFSRVLSINLNGVFYGMAAALEVMHRHGHGAIVHTASDGGIRGVGNQSGYAASKHGVVGLTRNSAVEYGQFGISINAIAPARS